MITNCKGLFLGLGLACWATAGRSEPTTFRETYGVAVKSYQAGDYAAALEQLDAAASLAQRPTPKAQVLVQRFFVYQQGLKQNEPAAEVVAELQALQGLSPDLVSYGWVLKAKNLRARPNPAKAQAAAEQAVAFDAVSPWYQKARWLELAVCAELNQDYAKARQAIETYRALDNLTSQEEQDALFRHASYVFELGEVDLAVKEFRELLAHPTLTTWQKKRAEDYLAQAEKAKPEPAP